MSNTVSLIVPVYNNWGGTHQLLSDIRQKCSGVSEVIVLDDCSPDEDVFNGMAFWNRLGVLPLKIRRNEKNLGFTKNANLGLRVANGDIKVLISTDVRIYSQVFISSIINLLSKGKALVGGVLYDRDTGWNTIDGKVYPYLEGWMLATTSDGWKELGYFDERFNPGDFEDVDLSTSALKFGYELKVVPSSSVSHLGGRSFGYTESRLERTKRNQELFKEKWSGRADN